MNINGGKNLDRTKITGTRGYIEYTHFAEADVTVHSENGQNHFDIPNPVHIQQPLIQLIVDELRGKGTCPSTGVSAARTNWVIDRVLGRIDPT